MGGNRSSVLMMYYDCSIYAKAIGLAHCFMHTIISVTCYYNKHLPNLVLVYSEDKVGIISFEEMHRVDLTLQGIS